MDCNPIYDYASLTSYTTKTAPQQKAYEKGSHDNQWQCVLVLNFLFRFKLLLI